jgi:hypothetical protein
MDTKTLVKALKTAVREVIKEELTEILREGLQPTILEMQQSNKAAVVSNKKNINITPKKSKVLFTENRWADILNETDAINEHDPTMHSFKEIMNEGIDEIKMTSRDAANFGAMRQNMKEAMGLAPTAPKVMEDPETGKVFEVPQEVQQAMTRDYSELMKAINNKKGK